MTVRFVESTYYQDMWHVSDGDDYAGLVAHYVPDRWRAYGSRVGLDFKVVSMEAEFGSQAEAVAWLIDGAGVES